jgi:hypothetical protein
MDDSKDAKSGHAGRAGISDTAGGVIVAGVILLIFFANLLGVVLLLKLLGWVVVIAAGLGALFAVVAAAGATRADDRTGLGIVAGVCAIVALIVFSLVGTGKRPPKLSPDQRYVGEIMSLGKRHIDRAKLTSGANIIQCHREFGMAIRALPNANVHPDLQRAAQDWSNSAIDFSTAVSDYSSLPGNDDAIVEGTARLMFGESLGSVWNHESNRVATTNAAWQRVELAHTRFDAAKADFSRAVLNVLSNEALYAAMNSYGLIPAK